MCMHSKRLDRRMTGVKCQGWRAGEALRRSFPAQPMSDWYGTSRSSASDESEPALIQATAVKSSWSTASVSETRLLALAPVNVIGRIMALPKFRSASSLSTLYLLGHICSLLHSPGASARGGGRSSRTLLATVARPAINGRGYRATPPEAGLITHPLGMPQPRSRGAAP